MITLLFVGVFSNSNSTNIAQAAAFEKLGCKVIRYDYREQLNTLGAKQSIDLCNTISFIDPDIVLFSKCNKMSYQPVEYASHYRTSILWYMDPLHNFDQELVEKIKCANYVFCALRDPHVESLKFNPQSFFIHEGFDENTFKPELGCVQNIDTSFIGSLYGSRIYYLNNLKNVKHFSNAFGSQHNEVVMGSKINLNFTEGGCSDRVYKILAAGGFLLTEFWPGLQKDFRIGVDLDTFRDLPELQDKIKFYLENSDLRKQIAKTGYETVQKFTVTNWAKKILEKVS